MYITKVHSHVSSCTFPFPGSKASMTSSKSLGGGTSASTSSPCHVTLNSRLPLAPSRPKVNSVLHLFGAWLVEAAIVGVKVFGQEKSGMCHVIEIVGIFH